ncbi:TPA: ATP-dependent DNA helicase RecG [Candidatus Ventrenecus avicola]|nr:ATP-dependent DNA helicase RecG [Candidatus Ventrenecus avicola]
MDLQQLKGVGEKTIEHFYQSNIYNLEELVSYYPYKYQILQPDTLEDSDEKVTLTINATVTDSGKVSYIRKNFNSLRFKVESYGKIINVTIFNRAFLKTHLRVGKEITLIGKYNNKTNMFTANDIKLSKLEGTEIIPVYHLIKGLKNNSLHTIIVEALKEIKLEDYIPETYQSKYQLLSKQEAIKKIHIPKNTEEIKEAKRTLIYEELFIFMFKIQYLKSLKEKEVGIKKEFPMEEVEKFIASLPFMLTNDQKKGVIESLQDLASPKKMNRLLLGDVGSGKTIVATVLLYANYLAGFQSAFLAPTEILATQHFLSIRELFKKTEIHIELLIGSMTKKEKQKIVEKVNKGDVDILIGTHAILSEKLVFPNLGFIVTDEQHRFGVSQREFLGVRNEVPDMLFMSATPIPRTYALTIYGDMDTTLIKEKPQGRKDIITKVVKESNLKEVLLKILEEIKQNHQVYVVAPMIEENEDTNLKDVYLLKEKFDLAYHGKIPIGILHGKLKKNEKESIMQEFKTGRTKILISTTVVEVGVDVKNATVMVIFNAERFGLATLHQLRGRVGRNDLQSYCYLICNEEKERLKVLEESNDGFYISEKDFEFRGEGDLFGTRQSGDMTFKMANLKRDYNILLKAKKDAQEFLETKNYEKDFKYQKIIKEIDFTN